MTTREFEFATHPECIAFHEGLQFADEDAGTVVSVGFKQRPNGRWVVTVIRRTEEPASTTH